MRNTKGLSIEKSKDQKKTKTKQRIQKIFHLKRCNTYCIDTQNWVATNFCGGETKDDWGTS